MRTLAHTTLALAALWGASAAFAQSVRVEDAWARASVPGQQATGAFMKLTASDGATKLVGVRSPAAGVAEIHEMVMQGDVMKMRAIDALDMPAGKTVELKPGCHHVMLMNLKAPLAAGSTVPVTLVFKNAQGAETRTDVQVPVHAVAAPAAHKH